MRTEREYGITRNVDGVLLVFRGYEGLWMIDRLADAPANERGDEAWIEVSEGMLEGDAAIEGSTAVSVDELSGMGERERRSYHARQLRKLGLPERGVGARVLWAMIEDFERFAP